MSFILQPWQLFLLALAGWINRRQQQKIDYLITENQVLKEEIGKKRILLNDDQRRRLAVKGKVPGRRLLREIATPDTLLRWHRRLVAQMWDHSDRRKKVSVRPCTPPVAAAAEPEIAGVGISPAPLPQVLRRSPSEVSGNGSGWTAQQTGATGWFQHPQINSPW